MKEWYGIITLAEVDGEPMSIEEFSLLAEQANVAHTLAVKNSNMMNVLVVYNTLLLCMSSVGPKPIVTMEDDLYHITSYPSFISMMVSISFLKFRASRPIIQ